MLSLTRKTDYALVALAFLGQQQASGEAGEAVSARRIADQFGFPLPLLMNILKELTHAKLITSTRGQQGGYVLAMDPAQINLLDVVVAMEGPIRLAQCTDHAAEEGQGCPSEGCCNIKTPVRRLHERIRGFLETVTLGDLMESRVDVPIEQVGVETG